MTDTVATRAGAGISLMAEAPDAVSKNVMKAMAASVATPAPAAPVEAADSPAPVAAPGDVQAIVDSMRQEFSRAIADVEFRLAQTYELKAREAGISTGDKVYVEDIVDYKHRLTGFQMLSNSNGTATTAGSIAWKSLHIVYLGVDYTIADGTTANKYAWFVKPASGTTASLTTGNTVPVLGPDDSLVFVNNAGVAIDATATNVTYAVAPGTVNQAALASDVQQILNDIDTDLTTIQGQVDGSITSYFQNEMPWAEGTSRDANTGDVWYDSNDGGAYRWTGPTGTKADGTAWPNKWLRIADTDTSSLAAKVGTKVTTYVGTAAPTAPTGGFTAGDMWIDTTGGANILKRWDGAAWITLQFGDGAISGVGASKVSGVLAAANIPTIDLATKVSGTLAGTAVGTGINAANVTTGTMSGGRVGTGINAANVDNGTMSGARVGTGISPANLTGTGTAPLAAVPAIPASKMNTAFHLLY